MGNAKNTLRGWGNKEELPWDSVSCHNVPERGAWAAPSGYTKVSCPTPWLLMSKNKETMATHMFLKV